MKTVFLIIIALLILVLVSQADAVDRYVDNQATGCSTPDNDYSPATRSCGAGANIVYVTGEPIKAAIAASAATDTVLVRAGFAYNDDGITMRNGTSAGNIFTLRGYQNEIPTIRPAGTTCPTGFCVGIWFNANAQWATAKNFRILLNVQNWSGQGCRGIEWDEAPVAGLVLDNIEIDGTGNVCNGSGGLRALHSGSSPNVTCVGCKLIDMHIHHVGLVADSAGNEGHGVRIANHQGVEIVGGQYHHVGDYCVIFYPGESPPAGVDPKNQKVHNATFGPNCGSGIGFYGATSAAYVEIYNNILKGNRSGGAAIQISGARNNSVVYSNTLYDNEIGVLYANSVNLLIRNNLFVGNSTNTFDSGGNSGITLTPNTTTGAAALHFVDAVNGDFRLCESKGVPANCASGASAAIDAGATLGSPYNVDIVGTGRPVGAGYSTGAYEEGGSAPPSCPASPALVAEYSFDDVATDSSGEGNNATLGAGWTYDNGKYNNGARASGTSSITVPHDASLLLCDFTIQLWVQLSTTVSTFAALLTSNYNNQHGWFLYAGSTGYAGDGAPIGGYGTPTASVVSAHSVLLTTAQTNVAVTYDRSNVRLFIDGINVNTVAGTATLSDWTGNMTIGGSPFGEYIPINSIIDEVRIYNYARTEIQINSDMLTPINAVSAGPGVTDLKVGPSVTKKIGPSVIFKHGLEP